MSNDWASHQHAMVRHVVQRRAIATTIINDYEPAVVLIADRVYAYGETQQRALQRFRAQIAGAPYAMQASMRNRAVLQPITCDHASEVAEMLAAEAIRWEEQS